MERVSRQQPISKTQFHQRLREWLEGGNELRVGPEDVIGVTAWIHVQDGSNIFGLHADTGRDAVNEYLEVVRQHGNDCRWEIALTERGKMNAVSYGPEPRRITSFYLYRIT